MVAQIKIGQANPHLSELVARAEAGEPIQISRGGSPVVELRAITHEQKPIDVAILRAVTDTLSPSSQSAEEFVRGMRDGDRY